ncbi:MAG: TIGR02921 family PEP-CTERM protein [bacterium]
MKKFFASLRGFKFSNLLFTLFNILAGVSLFFGILLFSMTGANDLPWGVARTIYFLIALVIISIVLYKKKLKTDPRKVLSYLFLVEFPSVLLAILLGMSSREWLPVAKMLQISIVFSILGSCLMIVSIQKNRKIFSLIELIAMLLGIVWILYCFLFGIFFIPAYSATYLGVFYPFFSDMWYTIYTSRGFALIWIVFVFLFVSVCFSFILGTPFLTTRMYINNLVQSYRETSQHWGNIITRSLALGIAMLSIVFYFLLIPKQQSVLTVKDFQTVTAKSFEEQQLLLADAMKNEKALKESLTESYLARYRYLFEKKNDAYYWNNGSAQVVHLYTNAFGINNPLILSILDVPLNFLAAPFVFDGSFYTEADNAAKVYAEVFGTDIKIAELKKINQAKATVDEKEYISQATQSDENSKNVHVDKKTITASAVDNSPFYKVTIEEEYENKSEQQQEVYYEFSLPYEAAVTGLWLGPELEYQGILAPKGAAQKTYEQQVNMRRDPALLEQIGPRQYKLRVFPIPVTVPTAGQNIWNTTEEDIFKGRKQRVKFEYIVAQSKDGIALPAYSHQRNVYSDGATQLVSTIDGDTKKANEFGTFLAPTKEKLNTLWCNNKILTATEGSRSIIGFPHNKYFNNSSANCSLEEAKDLIYIPSTKNIAILLDYSYPNKGNEWEKILKPLTENPDLVKKNNIQLYFFTTSLSKPMQVTAENIKNLPSLMPSYFFGKSNITAALKKIDSFKSYSDIIVISAGKSKTLEEDISSIATTPIHLVYPDGMLPAYSDEMTTMFLKKGNTVDSTLKEALVSISFVTYSSYYSQAVKTLTAQLPPSTTGISQNLALLFVTNQATWWLYEKPLPNNVSDESAKLLLHQLYYAAMPVSSNNTMALDSLYAIARKGEFVSPLASYIALVNQQQMNLLKLESEKNWKYSSSPTSTTWGPSNPIIPWNPTSISDFGSTVGIVFSAFGILFGAIIFLLLIGAVFKAVFRKKKEEITTDTTKDSIDPNIPAI